MLQEDYGIFSRLDPTRPLSDRTPSRSACRMAAMAYTPRPLAGSLSAEPGEIESEIHPRVQTPVITWPILPWSCPKAIATLVDGFSPDPVARSPDNSSAAA